MLNYPRAEHSDFVVDWMRPPTLRLGVVDLDEADAARRKQAYIAAYGKEATLLREENIACPPVAHARDLCRIVQAVGSNLRRNVPESS